MINNCRECEHIGKYTTGSFVRAPHYCCELIWELFTTDYRVDPDTVDENCPLKNKELVKAILNYRRQLGFEEEI